MRGRTGYRSCWDVSTGVPVYHSAEIALFDDNTESGLVIAHPGDPNRSGEGGDSNQAMATLGTRRAREEIAIVHCLAWYSTGDSVDGSMQAAWDGAAAIVDEVDAELRGDVAGIGPSLGLVPAYREVTCQFDAVTGVRPYASTGLVCEMSFDLRITARL
jgi:hypothetical protein